MHEVEDTSFGFALPEPEPMEVEVEEEPEPSPVPSPPAAAPPLPRPPPNTSAKRTRPDASPKNTAPAPAQATRSAVTSPPQTGSSSRSRAAVYDISDHSSTDGKRQQLSSDRAKKKRGKSSALSSALRRVSLEVPAKEGEEDDEDEMEDAGPIEPVVAPVPASTSPQRSSASLSRRTSRLSLGLTRSPLAERVSAAAEEVGESPANAPGSGRRRPLRISNGAPVVGSSTLLQRVLEDLDETTAHVPSSSPLQRVAVRRRSGEAGSAAMERQQRRSVRLSGGSTAGDANEDDELTPDRPTKRDMKVKSITPKPKAKKRARLEPTSPPAEEPLDEEEVVEQPVEEEVPEEPVEEDVDAAQEIGDKEAARRLTKRKRPRQSLPASPSPELHTEPTEVPGPATKRRRRKEVASPAQQQQPKAPKRKPAKKQAASKKGPKAAAADDDEADGRSVPVTVHRFTKKTVVDEDEQNAEILNAEIPFANRGGVNAVDVLSKLCEELIGAFSARLEENVRNAEDTAGRREQRTMLRSLEAFQEELRTRLLEHVSPFSQTMKGAIIEADLRLYG